MTTHTDNKQSEEAQEVLTKSGFLKHVDNFARFTAPEYNVDIDHSKRSLVIIAAEDFGDNEMGTTRIILGSTDLIVQSLARTIEDDAADGPISRAYMLADVRDVAEQLKELRRFLRINYGFMAMAAAYALFTVAWHVHYQVSTITTIGSLILGAIIFFLIGRTVQDLRRTVRRLEARRNAKRRFDDEKG